MTVLRSLVVEEFLPEYSTVVIRDRHRFGQHDDSPARLAENTCDFAAHPGSVAVAGAGWLKANATDEYQDLRFEIHDGPPPDDSAGWDDVLDTPYLSANEVIGNSSDYSLRDEIELGVPGHHRVRVARRGRDDQGMDWRFQFWPADPEPPRWLVRSRPVVRGPYDQWSSVLEHVVYELRYGVRGAASDRPSGVTREELAQWFADHRRPDGWLDEQVWAEPQRRPPAGDSALDAQADEAHQRSVAYLSEQRDKIAEHARQVGLPAPRIRADLLDLLVALGLVVSEDGRYRSADPVPRPQDVLRLPEAKVRGLESSERDHRYGPVAADLVSVVMWSGGSLTTGLDELADRLLASPEEIRAGLRQARAAHRLDAPDDDGLSGAFTLVLPVPAEQAAQQPAAPPAEAESAPPSTVSPLIASSVVVDDDPIGLEPDSLYETLSAFSQGLTDQVPAVRIGFTASAPQDQHPADSPVVGPPPRTGVVAQGGSLLVWRDGERVELACPRPRRPARAMRTAYGIVLFYYGHPAVLVHDDGSFQEFGSSDLEPWGAYDGRYLAVAEMHYGRDPWRRVSRIDLTDGSTEVMPWDDSRDPHVAGIHEGIVHVAAYDSGWRWVPGTDPVQLDHRVSQVDSTTGTMLRWKDGWAVVRADGTTYPFELDAAGLTPGGDRLMVTHADQATIAVYEVGPRLGEPRMIRFETDPLPSVSLREAVWEDAGHLLVPFGGYQSGMGVRIDIATGERETIGGEGVARPLFVAAF